MGGHGVGVGVLVAVGLGREGVEREVGGHEAREEGVVGRLVDGLELLALGGLVEAVATLGLHGGDAEGGHAAEAGHERGGDLVDAGRAHRRHAGDDAAARRGDGLVVGAVHAGHVLVVARAHPGSVGVSVDEARGYHPLDLLDGELGVAANDLGAGADSDDEAFIDDQRGVVDGAERIGAGGVRRITGDDTGSRDDAGHG